MSEPSPADAAKRKSTPPWLFAFAGMAYGVANIFTGQLMPKLTDEAHVSLSTISKFTFLLFIPAAFQFLYAPIVEFGPRRRVWVVMLAAASAVSLVIALSMHLPGQTIPFLAFGFVAQLLAALISAAAGGLLATTIEDQRRGAASAWYNVGNLSGGGLAAFVSLELLGEGVQQVVVGLVVAVMLVGPAVVILLVHEPARTKEHSIGESFQHMLSGVWSILSSKIGIITVLLFLSPVGTAAMTNFFSAMKNDFGASDRLVAIAAGGLSAPVTAIGALVGGYLCDRYNRRVMYLWSGALTAVVAVGITQAPHSPTTYIVGATVYNLVTGFCYSSFTATVLETVGTATKGASTLYALCVSAGNIAIAWVGVVDTAFKDGYGIDGVFIADAVLNIAGVALLALLFWKFNSFGKKPNRHATELPTATAIAKDKAS